MRQSVSCVCRDRDRPRRQRRTDFLGRQCPTLCSRRAITIPRAIRDGVSRSIEGIFMFDGRMSAERRVILQTLVYRQLARMLAKVLRGAKPTDVPVEQPTVFELAINLDAAKAIGLTVPMPLLVRADRVI